MKMWPSLISLDQFQGTESLTSFFHFVVTLVTKSEANFDYHYKNRFENILIGNKVKYQNYPLNIYINFCNFL